MKKMWELFEKMDEMVYVSDVDTNQIIYMNEYLRSALGFRSHEEYVGKLCYEVLQGRDSPCPFCTNQQLRQGEFVSWIHKNLVLNKRFLIKDTMIFQEGRRYRIEIAIDADAEVACKTSYYYARSETILNECLQQIFSTTDPEESIRNMLSYIGETFLCDRTYIFELSNTHITSNTYEWCREGVTPQKELLQNIPVSALDWWMALFAQNEVTVIEDLENIRKQHPEAYAILKPQGISSLTAGPIQVDGQVIGFIGADNPDNQMFPLIISLLNVIGYFTSTLLKRRDLLDRLNELSYHDQLTGALNRHALAEAYQSVSVTSAGVIYCDITGLKRTNDTQGHEAGDQTICRCYEMIREAVGTDMVYRTGGDEFVAVCLNCGKTEFYNRLYHLQSEVRRDKCHIAVGSAWSEQQPLDLEELVIRADQEMYQDKRNYYHGSRCRAQRALRQKSVSQEAEMPAPREEGTIGPLEGSLQMFLTTAYCDVESMFQSAAKDNDSSYFYLGDMQRDLFYISDNMREDFGFQSNLVPGLLKLWAKRISTPEFQDLFWQDIFGMLREKRTCHDLRYQVRDVHGNNQWIRCYGILKWNEDKTAPLFFSGRVTHQDKNFVIDPITNFPREHASFKQLTELQKQKETTLVIGFSLNGITEINSTKGRPYSDRLIKKVSDSLTESLSWKMAFYRLEGMRCMAVVNPLCCSEGGERLVEQIRAIIKTCYESMGISIGNVCSFALMEYPFSNFKPEDLIENLLSLIRVAKQEVKLSYVDYSAQNVQRIRRMSQMALTLSQDVANGMEHFRIMVQPVVSAGDGAVIGGEVLLRWTFEGRDVSPATFIPVLEKDDLIHVVGRWVFEQAVCTCVRLHAYNPAFYLTFNVSLQQLSDPLLLPFMEETLEKYGLDGSNLVAELTESCLDEQPDKLNSFVSACQKLGIYIALDDFGSGYSSLRMLLQYPSSIIKLDRSLVREVTESEAKMHFIRSIVFACHQFGKTVCMEGVEREDQNEIILNTGCDMIQGYYYHRPMELGDVYRLVSQND